MSIQSFREILRTMVKPSPRPDAFHQIEQEARTRLYGLFVWARLAAVPLIVALVGWIVFNDSTLWRQILLGLLMVSLTTISVWDVYLYSWKKHIGSFAIQRNAAGAGLAILAIIFSTGALESPLLPLILIISLVTTLVVGPRIGRIMVVGFQLPALWCFAFVTIYELLPGMIPDVFGGGTRAGRSDMALWTTAAVYTFVLMAIISFGVRLRRAFTELLKQTLDERDAALQMHSDQNSALMALTGEIAHELKNPLASVKGLAALVARGQEEGSKPAERMGVLRREVDRMQSVLEEFLNFSRPLVPLSQESTDLVALCHDVVELHEGVTRERDISIEVRGRSELTLLCDRRKIKQILINMVQNAFEASPRGSRIMIDVELETDGTGARLHVIDEGPGLAEGVGERAFDPGVTSKAKGSGLGLTVARALARQHGGDLSLENDTGGGCRATLLLPETPDGEEDSEGGAL